VHQERFKPSQTRPYAYITVYDRFYSSRVKVPEWCTVVVMNGEERLAKAIEAFDITLRNELM